jgi:hypothetical protein
MNVPSIHAFALLTELNNHTVSVEMDIMTSLEKQNVENVTTNVKLVNIMIIVSLVLLTELKRTDLNVIVKQDSITLNTKKNVHLVDIHVLNVPKKWNVPDVETTEFKLQLVVAQKVGTTPPKLVNYVDTDVLLVKTLKAIV